MIPLGEIIRLSIQSLLRNKTRSLLTMLGIIIGVSAVILLVSIGQGLQNYITQQFESLGSNLIVVLPGKVGGGSGLSGAPNLAGSKLTLNDVNSLSRLGGPIESVGAGIEMPAGVSYQGKSTYTTVGGLTAEYQKMRNLVTSSGRQISDSDNASSRPVADIGQTVIDNIFGNIDPIGKKNYNRRTKI